jgi:hypothetical protein
MTGQEAVPPVAVPADIDAPDRIAWGLTARQLAILAVAGAAAWAAYRALAGTVPPGLLLAAAIPAAGVVAVVVLGRRDGLPMDRWLAAALRWWRTPPLQTPTPGGPGPVHTTGRPPLPGVLRLPADTITSNGTLRLPGGGAAVVVAAGSVNLALRTPTEQAALLGGFARWLHSLPGPGQIVISTQHFDLDSHARTLDHATAAMPHAALAAAAGDHAGFLRQLGSERDPLRRQALLILHGDDRGTVRGGEATARAMTALGVHARVLDGPALTAAVAAAVDPYTPPAAGPRATPDVPVTARREP